MTDQPDKSITEVLSIKDLFQVIFERLHQLYAVDCAVLILYDHNLTQIADSYISRLSDQDVVITEHISGRIPLSFISETIAKLEFPVLTSKAEWVAQAGQNHQPLSGDPGYHYHCYIPLEANNRIMGTLELHNYKNELSKECLAYCTNMTDFFGDCLLKAKKDNRSDVDMPRLENEDNELLLSLIGDIAAIKDRDGLAAAVAEKFRLQLAEINHYKQLLEEEKLYLQEEVRISSNYAGIIGEGDKMQQVFSLLEQVADTETTVLILGETGTGKELIARAIHNGSVRKDKVMVKVNCAAIPPGLIESELFGHEKGSFTGATERRLGKFELASKSTLFLDEIGELSLELQVKLLRALQEKEIERVGGTGVIPVDVRIVSATNRNLLEEVEAGRFRRDLFYRLNVFPIILPSLRHRTEDIPLLASHFLARFSSKAGKSFNGFSKKALQGMINYNWPGNVRELEHLIERQVLLTKGLIIKSIDIPSPGHAIVVHGEEGMPVKTIYENERDHIFTVLKLCKGKVSGNDGAAKLLGVPATTLNSKIKRLSLSKKHIF